MEDVAPELLKKLQKDFKARYNANQTIAALYKKVRDGTAVYKDASDLSAEIGKELSKTFAANLSSADLPDGKLYYNIAERTVKPMLNDSYELISKMGIDVQNVLNKSAKIGIKAIGARLNEDKVQGILDIVSGKDVFDDIAYMLNEPIINFCQTIIDDTVKANVDFQGKAGLEIKVVRVVMSDCCEWCREIAGEYSYPDVPKDVYRRHKACNCLVTYVPKKGRAVNVWK